MSIFINNIVYTPSVYVEENGQGTLTIDFDVTLSCDGLGKLEPVFTWEIDLEDDAGNIVRGPDGSLASVSAIAPSNGGQSHVTYAWQNPPLPDGGARPYITVQGACSTVVTVGSCSGITKIKSFREIDGDRLGPKIRVCMSCRQAGCRRSY